MGRIAIWSANTGLFVLCCWLVAANLNQVASAMLAPAAAAVPSSGAAPEPAVQRSFADRQVILDRNLFNVSSLLPKASAPVVEEEDLEATRLPLKLLGTAASTQPELSWAAVDDQQERRQVTVRIGDELAGSAKVVAIERRRIVLDNRGNREELALEEDTNGKSARKARPKRSARAARRSRPSRQERPRAFGEDPDAAARVRQLAKNRYQVNREDVVELAGRNPAEVFSSARILPKYEGGQMVGIQLNNVKSGSLFEDIGIQEGDVIRQFNGIAIDSPQGSAEVLRELTQADRFEVTVTGSDGSDRTLTYEVQ